MKLFLAILFYNASLRTSASLIPVQHEKGLGDSLACINGEEEDSCLAPDIPQNITIDAPIYAADDPHLKQMPNRDFKAYVRPDVATFYKEEPGARRPSSHKFIGQAGKFINMTPDRLNLYW